MNEQKWIRYIGIKDGKVFDITTDLECKRDIDDKTIEYIETSDNDIYIDDTWENNISLKDSYKRIEVYTPILELKIKELEARISKLEEKEVIS